MKKGQAVLEFLFLLLVIIIYLTTLVVPMSKDAQSAISDTEKISRANNETQKLANAVGEIAMLGEGSRKTVDVFVPEDTKIDCNAITNSLTFEVTLSLKPYPPQCNATTGTCTKSFPQSPTLQCNLTELAPYSKASVKIEKLSGGTVAFSIGS